MPNYSFEDTIDCLNVTINNSPPWCGVGLAFTSHLTPCQLDTYFQAPYQSNGFCESYQIPRTGKSYAAISIYNMNMSTDYYTIPQVKLKDTLQFNKIYCVTFYVSLYNNDRYSVDKLGARLSSTPLPCISSGNTNTTVIAGVYSAQVVSPAGVQLDDTLNWMEISGVYTALGNEAYLTIGDFFFQSQHSIIQTYPANCNGVAEYYLDDVSVEEVQLAKCKNDTSICPTDSVLLGNNVSEATAYSWQPTNGLSCPTCANPKASPNVTTTYTLTKTQCKALTTASITVTVKTDCTPKVILSEIPNVFTPNGDGINDTFHFSIVGASDVSFAIYNRWGLSLTPALSKGEGVVPPPQRVISWDGRTTSGMECSEGVYFYTLQYTDVNGDVHKKNGYVSLMR